jgi:hypothetical protein
VVVCGLEAPLLLQVWGPKIRIQCLLLDMKFPSLSGHASVSGPLLVLYSTLRSFSCRLQTRGL